MKTKAQTLSEIQKALAEGIAVYAKNAMGDWIRIDAVNDEGHARVADHLSGFNSGTIGQWMTPNNCNIDLNLREFEIQY